MRLKFFVLIVLINFHASYGQTLSCIYSNAGSSSYSCSLTITNPNGFNNFTSIGGTHLAGMTDNDVRYITRNSGSTTNIPSIICDKFQNLIKITLSYSGIQVIDDRAFKNCIQLRELWLDSNQIRSIHENAFIENLELLFITFNVNQLSHVQEHLFINQHKMTELRLCSVPLSDMPGNIFESLHNLTMLHLESNSFKNLRASWFAPLTSIQTIYLENNAIEELPLNVFSYLTKLSVLHLYYNKLKVIHSESFRGASSLQKIDFQSNLIEAIDEKVIDYTGVQTLNLLNNICYNQNIVDTTPSRNNMRLALRTCFDNYAALTPETTLPTTYSTSELTTIEQTSTDFQTPLPDCSTGNLDERVCKLEDSNDEIQNENQQLQEITKVLREEVDELKNQVLILSTRPCSCN